MDTESPSRRGKDPRRHRAEREREIAALATRQHGVIARRQLVAAGLGSGAIARRVEAGRIHRLHQGVYAFGHAKLSPRGHWMAAVLACGRDAVLSHRSAAELWGLVRARGAGIEVSAQRARRRPGIVIHGDRMDRADRTIRDSIPVTTVARTLLDLAGVDERVFERAFEEADRQRLLVVSELEDLCARCPGRHGLRPIRRLIAAAREPAMTRSRLEERFAAFCHASGLRPPVTNALVLGCEVDALWPAERLVVELDGFAFHRHRAAFERDRARDARLQADGYRVIRITHRRLEREPSTVAAEIRRLLRSPANSGQAPDQEQARRQSDADRGQGTVEWVGLLLVVALLLLGIVAAGVRVPGTVLARAVASRILCAAALADSCGDEPALIGAYGTEVGKLVRHHMPTIVFERGSHAVPVDFRRCRSTACDSGPESGVVRHTDGGLPVTAFVHVVDCREGAVEPTVAAGADCSGGRAGRLYIQYWTYYADSATFRGVPVAGAAGYHPDDWEGVQVRIGADGQVDERATSHHGYNHARSVANLASDAGVGPLRDLAEAVGARPRNGWGPESRVLVVSGGSHAGNMGEDIDVERLTPGRSVHLIPLEPIAAAAGAYRFAISAPWSKQAWRDPEARGTD